MMTQIPHKRALLAALFFAAACDPSVAQTARERMWPAATAAGWKKPVLIKFQRTWEDALAVSKETRRPILICINMDGEIASEHYAGIRYREPAKAKLYDPYVCVIASVYRHTPRDYDEHGHRVLCPRFGSVTCGEHIAIEPILYEKFFDGKRIAPRHIMVELDGKEAYDVYYAFDTDSVFKAIDEGMSKRNGPPPIIVRGDRTIVERVASRDLDDRKAVEKAYTKGDAALRRRLLEAALQNAVAAPDDLLRLAIFGFEPDLSRLARQALSSSTSAGSIDVINEALRVPMGVKERESLIAALGRLGKSSRRARTLAVVHKGLASKASGLDVGSWSSALAGSEYPAPADRARIESRLEAGDKASRKRPADPNAKLELAEASLALALDPETARTRIVGVRSAQSYARLMFEDARTAALEAERLGAKGWRVDSTLAIASKHLGDRTEADKRAEAAIKSMPARANGKKALTTLELFAAARQRAIVGAWRRKQDWAPNWVTDVHSTYAVIARHPLGTATHAANHYDFLVWLGAKGKAARCLNQGLTKFPESWVLHDRLRSMLLKDKGIAGLEETYEAMLKKPGASPTLSWFAGYTSIVAAEFHRRAGSDADAIAAYNRAVAHYEQAIKAKPGSKPSADHYIALAIAGKARLAFERTDNELALDLLLASFARKASAAATLDGLSLSPVDTAKMVLAALRQEKRDGLAEELQAALGKLDPKMLELPAYEGQGRRGRNARRGR